MKVVVAGSRSIGRVGPRKWDYEALVAILDRAIAASGLAPTEIISGGANGPDRAAALWAERKGVKLTELVPDWQQGKWAGMARNTDLVRAGEALVALYDGKSSGTADTIKKMRKKGGPVHVETIRWEPDRGEA